MWLVLALGLALLCLGAEQVVGAEGSFVKVEGVHFSVDGKAFYVNGWNSYWFMSVAVDRFYQMQAAGQAEEAWENGALEEVRQVLEQGSKLGMTVCRTWAFSDGGYHALQIKPGVYEPFLFQALDHVLAEARKYKVKLILSLANDWPAFGGKAQYVAWAVQAGHRLSIPSNDSFYMDSFIKRYYKDYVMDVVTRINTVTGVAYKDDPTILAWELINEPRCSADPSGQALKAWIQEMAAYVKFLDKNHLVTVGLEGFYGGMDSSRHRNNPAGGWSEGLGTDFIEQNKVAHIDFASVHAYPDNWVPWLSVEDKLHFFNDWVDVHIDDAEKHLGKPVLFTEFGISDCTEHFLPEHRRMVVKSMFSKILQSAKGKGAGAGSLIWQFVAANRRNEDQFSISPYGEPPVAQLFAAQSCQLQLLTDPVQETECFSIDTDNVD